MSFEDRRRFTKAGKPKRRPGPKPRAFANVRHRTRAVHKYWNPLHVTMRAVRGLPTFRAQTLYGAFERAVRRTRREDFRVVEYSIQDDHLHLIKKHHGVMSGVRRIDPCSSARWFTGWNAVREQQDGDGPRPSEVPRTVLLRAAWQMHGLIDPGERPHAPG